MKNIYTPTIGDTKWLMEDRFGMFIHFGLYTVPSRHEWIKTMERIPDSKYDKYAKYFNPSEFDANEWAKKAKEAGMKYAVLTTKHHDGFCMFDSKYTDYKITNTPFGRDVVREYVDAFRRAGLKIGLYYSIIDWHHPHFPIDGIHPRRDDLDAEIQDKGRDMRIYNEYARNQVTELLTNYGKIDVIWYDFFYDKPEYVKLLSFDKKNPPPRPDPLPWMQHNGVKDANTYESEKLMALTRSLMPGIVVNDRLGIPGDTITPEQITPGSPVIDKNTGLLAVWEACHTFSGSWGYNRDENTWKSPETLIRLLVEMTSMGGNLLMNVGPTSRGYFDDRANNSLEVYSRWMKKNSRSIYNCGIADDSFIAPEGTLLTQSNDGKRLYLHLPVYQNKLVFKGASGKFDYAQFLFDGSEILFSEIDSDVVFDMPDECREPYFIVIELFLK